LFKKKCPIPNCKIRQEHRHAITFSEEVKDGKWSLEKQGEKWKKMQGDTLGADSLALSAEADSTSGKKKKLTKEEKKERKKKKKLEKQIAKANKKKAQEDATAKEASEKDADFGYNELDEDLEVHKADNYNSEEHHPGDNVKQEETDGKKKKKKRRKKGDDEISDAEKLKMEEELYADESDYTTSDKDKLTEDEIKANELAAEEAAKNAKKEGKDESEDILNYWRSRITKWFRKDQKPKIGKYWKAPKSS